MAGFIEGLTENGTRLVGWVHTASLSKDAAVGFEGPLGGAASFLTVGAPRDDVQLRTGRDGANIEINFDRKISPEEVLLGKPKLLENPGSRGMPLLLLEQFRKQLIEKLSADMEAEYQERLSRLSVDIPELGATRVQFKNLGAGRSERSDKPESGTTLSYLNFPIGFSSIDGTRVLGKDGWVFLGGKNSTIAEQYLDPKGHPEIQNSFDAKLNAWRSLVSEREARATSDSIELIQLFIPEKHSVLASQSPLEISGPTKLYEALVQQSMHDSVLDGFEALNRIESDSHKWSRYDTHCSPRAVYEMARDLISRFGLNLDGFEGVDFDEPYYRTGDLVENFFGEPIWETLLRPGDSYLNSRRVPTQTFAEDPKPSSGHRHRGIVRVWETSDAPIDATVFVQGLSTSGWIVDHLPENLNWWLARQFSRCEFHFGPDLDWEAVRRAEAEFVVVQTIERYMNRVPTA